MDFMVHKKHLGKSLIYQVQCHLQIIGYANDIWVGSPTYKKSTLGYYIIMEVKLIKKQKKYSVIGRLSAKVEYKVIAIATYNFKQVNDQVGL